MQIAEEILSDMGKTSPFEEVFGKKPVLALPKKATGTVPAALAAFRNRHVPSFKHSSYSYRFMEPPLLRECISNALLALKGWRNDFDAVAFRGMSGALLGPPVALAMNKTMIMVRKEDEDSHAAWEKAFVEGDSGARRYIVLDDFVSSGKTAYKIKEAISTFAPLAEFLGVLQVYQINECKLEEYRGKKYPLWTGHGW